VKALLKRLVIFSVGHMHVPYLFYCYSRLFVSSEHEIMVFKNQCKPHMYIGYPSLWDIFTY